MHSPRSFRCNVCTTYLIISLVFFFSYLRCTFIFRVYLDIHSVEYNLIVFQSTNSRVATSCYRWLLRTFNESRRDTAFISIYSTSDYASMHTPSCCISIHFLFSFNLCLFLTTLLICIVINGQSSLFFLSCCGLLRANIQWLPTFSCIRLRLNYVGIRLIALKSSFCCSLNVFLLVCLHIFLIFLLIDVVILQIRLLSTKSIPLSK